MPLGGDGVAQGQSLWAYMTTTSDGAACVVSVIGPNGRGPQILVARTRAYAEAVLAKPARRHAEEFKRRVWLREYTDFVEHGEV